MWKSGLGPQAVRRGGRAGDRRGQAGGGPHSGPGQTEDPAPLRGSGLAEVRGGLRGRGLAEGRARLRGRGLAEDRPRSEPETGRRAGPAWDRSVSTLGGSAASAALECCRRGRRERSPCSAESVEAELGEGAALPPHPEGRLLDGGPCSGRAWLWRRREAAVALE